MNNKFQDRSFTQLFGETKLKNKKQITNFALQLKGKKFRKRPKIYLAII